MSLKTSNSDLSKLERIRQLYHGSMETRNDQDRYESDNTRGETVFNTGKLVCISIFKSACIERFLLLGNMFLCVRSCELRC